VDDVIKRILFINVFAIHTSSMVSGACDVSNCWKTKSRLAVLQTFTQALYDLAARPQYIQPMREEVEAVIQEEGWTKAALGQMYKVDSFIKESMRHNGLSSCTF
jgi:hypothetical protein